jgi:anaerobic magnesium-protoporphyrin IX monomethyl ester cyclase
MRKNKIDMDWICEGRVDQASLEMLKAMAQARCRILFYGIESANQRILNYFNKKITPAQSILAVNKARTAKIPYIIGSFIIGAPTETFQEIRSTLEFTLKLDIDFPLLNILCTTPGTIIWNELVKKKILDEEKFWELGVTVADIDPAGISLSRISSLVVETLKNFFQRTPYIWREFYRTFTNSYRLRATFRVIANNFHKFRKFAGARSFALTEQAE